MFESKKTIQMWADRGDDFYYGINGEKVDYKTAFYFYIDANKKKHPHATFMYGLCKELGRGTNKDIKFALSLYEEAAKYGDPDAKKRMQTGKLYEPSAPKGEDDEDDDNGDEVEYEEDHEKADRELAEAFDERMKEKGLDNVDWEAEDDEDGEPLYSIMATYELKELAEQGDYEAMYRLGSMYIIGGDEDDMDFADDEEFLAMSEAEQKAAGLRYMEQAAEGNADCAFWLAEQYDANAYVFVRHLPADRGAAVKWYIKAAENGHEKAEQWVKAEHAKQEARTATCPWCKKDAVFKEPFEKGDIYTCHCGRRFVYYGRNKTMRYGFKQGTPKPGVGADWACPHCGGKLEKPASQLKAGEQVHCSECYDPWEDYGSFLYLGDGDFSGIAMIICKNCDKGDFYATSDGRDILKCQKCGGIARDYTDRYDSYDD